MLPILAFHRLDMGRLGQLKVQTNLKKSARGSFRGARAWAQRRTRDAIDFHYDASAVLAASRRRGHTQLVRLY
jgi:hypothetical protein